MHVRTVILSVLLLTPALLQAKPTLLWETEGLAAPESVVFDAKHQRLYVSNINGAPDAKDGNGFISALDLNGEVQQLKWIDGLDAPKGLALHDGKLYIADLQTLVVADVESGKVIQRYAGEGAQFFNDVAADSSGNVYVSDQQAYAIHRLQGESFTPWLASNKHDLCSPNGLLAEKDRLVVGCWTWMLDEFDDNLAGHMRTIGYADQAIGNLGDGSPQGYLDGVESDGKDGYLVTDWVAGKLLAIDADGNASELLPLENGSADHEVISDKQLILIPMMVNNTLRAYKLD